MKILYLFASYLLLCFLFTCGDSLTCPLPELYKCTRFIPRTYIPYTTVFCSKIGYGRCTHNPLLATKGKNVDIEGLKAAMRRNSAYIIDVRRKNEVVKGKLHAKRWVNVPHIEIESAFNMTASDFYEKYGAKKPRINERIIFHCRSGLRSRVALAAALELGYTKVKHYPGGWLEWSAKQLR